MDSADANAWLADRLFQHALVLGGTGFIGAPVVRALAAAGVKTTCLVHRSPPPVPSAGAVSGSMDWFPWRALEADPPDVIFHLARIPGRGGWRGPVTRLRNRLANERLLLWVASCPRPPLVVYVGGTLAYGSHGDDPVTETTPLSPVSFSRDYHAAELPWLRGVRWSAAPIIVARPAWVLGPGSWFHAYFRRPLRESGAVPLYGDGANWMSLVHVEDCAELIMHAARRAPLLTAVNVFTGAPLRQLELVERMARLTGRPIRRVTLTELEARHGRQVREAFSFSARIASVYPSLQATFSPRHVDLDRSLASLLAA